jgi:antitoxin ParD1/3/4
MPTRNITLSAEQDAFVEKVVRNGQYETASDAIRDALQNLQAVMESDALKLERLRREVRVGLDDMAAGRFVSIPDDALDALITGLGDERP